MPRAFLESVNLMLLPEVYPPMMEHVPAEETIALEHQNCLAKIVLKEQALSHSIQQVETNWVAVTDMSEANVKDGLIQASYKFD